MHFYLYLNQLTKIFDLLELLKIFEVTNYGLK